METITYTLTSDKGDNLSITARHNGHQYAHVERAFQCDDALWMVVDELIDAAGELLEYATLNSDVAVGDVVGQLTVYLDPEEGYQVTWAEDAHGFITEDCEVLETLTFKLTRKITATDEDTNQ